MYPWALKRIKKIVSVHKKINILPQKKNVSGNLGVILKGNIGNSEGRDLKLGGS